MKAKVFITGITGCVGHYIFDLLIKNPEYELYLLVRNPKKMMRDLSGVRVIQDELKNIKNHEDLLAQMDYVVHAAAGWGETEANDEYTLNFFNLLNPEKVKKVIYFSTASILGSDNKLVPGLDKIGTSYIKGKFRCHRQLPKLKIYDKIITLYPTWVLGGSKNHPYSHATEGIKSAVKWLWLVRFFTFDLSFHFIHAADIALIVDYLLKNETKEKNYVLGNQLITATELIKQICRFFHKRVYFMIKISSSLVKLLAGRRLSDWDRYCLDKKDFSYGVVNPEAFGLKSNYNTLSEILDSL